MIDTPWPSEFITFNEITRLALALMWAVLLGELLHRHARCPRITGYALTGLLLGPTGLTWFSTPEFHHFKLWVDFALTLLLFELGIHVNLRWLFANPWVITASLLESALTFGAVFGALSLIHAEPHLAAFIAAISMGTSPVIVMRVASESRAQGQITQRLFVLTALNTVYATVMVNILLGNLHVAFKGNWVLALMHPAYLLLGSIGMGIALAIAFKWLRRYFDFSNEQGGALLFGLLLLLLSFLEAFDLPILLAPLLGGMAIKFIDPRPQLWPRYFGTAGAILVIMMFILAGSLLTWDGWIHGAVTAVVVLAVRSVAKMAGALSLAPPALLSMKQALSLGIALSPMSVSALILVENVRLFYPTLGNDIANVVLTLMILLELISPSLVQAMLHRAGETLERDP